MCVLHWKHLLQSCFEHETFAACICSETWRHYNKWSQMSQTCLHLFSKPVGVGYRYQPYLRTLWSAGGKSGIKLRCKTWRRNTYYCPTEKASTNVESCLVMSIAHWPCRPCICFTRSGFAPWGAVVYVVLSKNAETRTALVYKRLVLRLQRLHLSQEVVGTTCLTWIFHLCWRY